MSYGASVLLNYDDACINATVAFRHLTHSFGFDSNTLLVLPLEWITEESDSEVHSGRPHAVPAKNVTRDEERYEATH